MQWRKAWAANWETVRFCSDACRKHRPSAQEKQLEATLLKLLHARKSGASVCPSEVARTVDQDHWETLMEPTRCAARRLVAQGIVEITQAGIIVDPSSARGPIRIRLASVTSEPELVGRKGKNKHKDEDKDQEETTP
jgi:hypothetical protein